MNKLLALFILADLLFAGTGGLLIALAAIWTNERSQTPNQQSVANVLLLSGIPLQAVIANGALILFTFLISLPALALPTSVTWLRVHSWLVVTCTVFTLILGLDIWLETLTTRANLGIVWNRHTADIQSLIQQEFSCCGYVNSTTPLFVQDSFCTNDVVAASQLGCVGPLSNYANNALGNIFTAAFGVVGLDFLLLLITMMLSKVRQEQRRYRSIDAKRGLGNI